MDKIGNFSVHALDSTYNLEGYYDLYNNSGETLRQQSKLLSSRQAFGTLKDGKRTYTFVFIPNNGFLNSTLPLLNDCELKISFDRSKMSTSFLQIAEPMIDHNESVIEIKNTFAVAEYISSEKMRNHFDRIETRPITYNYDECDITLKTLPQTETSIRIDNIRGGNNPFLLFIGLIRSKGLTGDVNLSSTCFERANVTQINITLNGKTVNGYPLENINGSSVMVCQKFYDVTNRYMNILSPDGLRQSQFQSNWVYGHKFEAKSTSQGWLGVHLELDNALKESYTMVIWSFQNCALTIDKFHSIEKILL